jgi:hypothetical protein
LKETVKYLDQTFDTDTILKITELRHERWALYAVLSLQPVRQAGTVFTQKQVLKVEKRIREVNAMLYELTKNEVYNVK